MASIQDFQGLNTASFWNGQFGSRAWLESLDAAGDVGANTIAVTSTSYVYDLNSTNIYSTGKTESLANVATAISDAKANGFQVVLKPHVDVASGQWRGHLKADGDAFLANYKEYILNYAEVGAANGADVLVLATELDQYLGAEYRETWADIIAEVREVFDGELTIAANWDAEVAVWDLVDYIGINPYVALDTDGKGSVDEYSDAWHQSMLDPWLADKIDGQSPFEFWQSLAETYDKPVLFTELGYRSMDGAASKPMDFRDATAVDEVEQAELFQAFFDTFGDQDWVAGSLIWDWSVDREASESRDFWDTGYTIEGKLAEAVVAQAYTAEELAEKSGTPLQTVPITVSLAGNMSDGAPEAVIVVDRVVVARISVTNTIDGEGFVEYAVDVPAHLLDEGHHKVEVHFANPYPGRGLHIDAVTIEDVRYEAEEPNATRPFVTAYSTRHVSEMEMDLPAVVPPTPEPADLTETMTFSLAANVSDGGAEAAIYLDGTKVGSFLVENRTWKEGFQDYALEVDAELLKGDVHDIEVRFANPGPGRGLHVDAMSVKGVRYEAEAEDASTSHVTSYNARTVVEFQTSAAPEVDPGQLLLNLAANTAGGDAEVTVLADGVQIATLSVGNRTWKEGFKDYAVDIPAELLGGTMPKIDLVFTNPAAGRGLHVGGITFGNERHEIGDETQSFVTVYTGGATIEAEGDGIAVSTFGTGAARALLDEVVVTVCDLPEPIFTDTLPVSGLEEAQEEGADTTQVTLSLAANVANGGAEAVVLLNGEKIGTILVENTTWQDGFKAYVLDVPSDRFAEAGDEITVQFANPAPGRGLHVDAVTVEGVRYEAETDGDAMAVTAYNSRTLASVETGTNGRAVVEGTDAADVLTGSDGADFIFGDGGNDVMTGGAGADVFVFESDAGSVTRITDFELGLDAVSFAGTPFSKVTGQDVDGDALVTLWHGADSQTVVVEDTQWSHVQDHFTF